MLMRDEGQWSGGVSERGRGWSGLTYYHKAHLQASARKAEGRSASQEGWRVALREPVVQSCDSSEKHVGKSQNKREDTVSGVKPIFKSNFQNSLNWCRDL